MERLTASRLAGWDGHRGRGRPRHAHGRLRVKQREFSGQHTVTRTTASSSPTATASALICQDVAALRTSLTNLTHVKVGSGASDALTANLKDVQAKLTTLGNDASGQYNAQISGLKTSLSALQKSVTGLSNGTSSVTNVVTALGGVKNSAQDLFTAAGQRCPSPSPSASG